MKFAFAASVLAYATSALDLAEVPLVLAQTQDCALSGIDCQDQYRQTLAQIEAALDVQLDLEQARSEGEDSLGGFSNLLGGISLDEGAQSAPLPSDSFFDSDFDSEDS